MVVLEMKGQHVLVYSIAVRPSFQGGGYGRLLSAFAEQHAKDMGVREILLYTNPRMASNIRLYRSCGFQEIGIRPHPNRTGEFLVDMSKTLEVQTGDSK